MCSREKHQSMVVVGIDPGITTGMCAMSEGRLVAGGEATTYKAVERFIVRHSPTEVVVEDFRINRSRPAEYHAPIRMIGVVEYLCEEWGIPMVLQSPSILTLSLPLADGMHRSRHVRSACAHVLYRLRKRR